MSGDGSPRPTGDDGTGADVSASERCADDVGGGDDGRCRGERYRTDLHEDDQVAGGPSAGHRDADGRFADDLYDESTLAAIDGWAPPLVPSPPPGISGWRRTSASGAVLGAALLGLGEALEGRRLRERPPIVVEDPGEQYDPDALVDVDFDEGGPAATTVRLRRSGHRAGGPAASGGERGAPR